MLEYKLQHGDSEIAIIEQAEKSGLPLPEKIENAPSILPGLELYYNGFLTLNTSRQVGMSIGYISWFTIQQYCDYLNLDSDQEEEMHYHIAEMDNAYLKFVQKSKPSA